MFPLWKDSDKKKKNNPVTIVSEEDDKLKKDIIKKPTPEVKEHTVPYTVTNAFNKTK